MLSNSDYILEAVANRPAAVAQATAGRKDALRQFDN
jgi:hypothetical protein